MLEAAKLEAELACWADAAERSAERQHQQELARIEAARAEVLAAEQAGPRWI